MAILTWERRDGQRMIFQLQSLETTIGRDAGNPIRIESGYVSKRHAVVRMGPQGYTLADLNSSNGTSVNGLRVTLAVLKDGDRIELGSEVLVFSDPMASMAPLAPPAPKRNPLMLAVIVGGGAIVLALVLLIALGGGPEPAATPSQPQAPPAGAAPPPAYPDAYQPATQQPMAPPANAPAALAPPASNEPLPTQDPVALYEMALAHIKGKRLVEARRFLDASVRLDPSNQSAQQRLREVDATIQAMIDQNLAAGQRDFMYLRYADAILMWEQVLSMTAPSDPRYQQAAAGVQRARERLAGR